MRYFMLAMDKKKRPTTITKGSEHLGGKGPRRGLIKRCMDNGNENCCKPARHRRASEDLMTRISDVNSNYSFNIGMDTPNQPSSPSNLLEQLHLNNLRACTTQI